MLKNVFVTVLALLITNYALAQYKIKGTVQDGSEKSPVGYATVALFKSADKSLVKGALTDFNGTYTLDKVKKGNYYLEIKFMGYEATVLNNIVVDNKDITAPVAILNPSQQLLEEIEVKGEKASAIHKVDRQVFDAKQFQASQGGSATDVLKNMPSVSVNGAGDISVRGTTGFVVLLNGKPVQSDAAMLLNQLPANAIQNVEVITAPSAKYDPEGKAGIINIITSQGATDGTFMQFNVQGGLPSIEPYDNKADSYRYGADFTVNHRKGKWDISAGLAYQRKDKSGRREGFGEDGSVWTIRKDDEGKLYKTTFASDGERSFDEQNYSGRLTVGYTPSKNDKLSIGFYGGRREKTRTADIMYYDNNAQYLDDSGEPVGNRLYTYKYYNTNDRTRNGDFVLGSLDYAHTFENKSKLSASLLYEYTMLGGPTFNNNWKVVDGVVTEDYDQLEENDNTNPLNGLRAQLDYKFKPFSFGTVEAGYQFRSLDHKGDFDYRRKYMDTDWFQVDEYSSDVNLKRILHSGYAQLSGKKGQWTYGVGARVEYMDRELVLEEVGKDPVTKVLENTKLYPSANLQYKASETFRIKTAYSKRVARTTTFKMNPFKEREHSETLEQGDADLMPEYIDLVELGIIKDFGDNSVFVTGYFRNVQNLINRVNTVDSDSVLNRIYSNVGTGQALGVEFGAELKPTKNWKIFAGANVYNYTIEGEYNNLPVNTSALVYSINANTTVNITPTLSAQWSLNYISDRVTAMGEDSRYYSPNLTVKKTFMDGRLSATVQWLNMDLGMLDTNEQRISTWRNTGALENQFYTTTNYVYEVDMIMINLSYSLNNLKNKAKFIKSEFGAKEF